MRNRRIVDREAQQIDLQSVEVEYMSKRAADSIARKFIRSVLVFVIERGSAPRRVLFPPNVQIIPESVPRVIPAIGATPCVAFRPVGTTAVYFLPEPEFFSCTELASVADSPH